MEVLFHVPRWNRSRWQIRQHAALGARVPSRTLVLLSHHVYIIRYDQNIYLCNNCNFLGSHPSPHQQQHQQQTTGVYLPYFLQTLSTDSRSQSLMPAVWHIFVFFICATAFFPLLLEWWLRPSSPSCWPWFVSCPEVFLLKAQHQCTWNGATVDFWCLLHNL